MTWDDLFGDDPVPGQEPLFDGLFGDDAQFHAAWREWGGMPEFEMEDHEAWGRVTFQFATEADWVALRELTGIQFARNAADAIWYPPRQVAHW